MSGHIQQILRSFDGDNSRAFVVILKLRAMASDGVISEYQARKTEKLICMYHATNDNWLNEMIDIMDSKIKMRPSLW